MGISNGLSTQGVLDALDDVAILQLSLDGHIEGWSRGAELMFGFSAEEVIGLSAAIVRGARQPGAVDPAGVLDLARDLSRAGALGKTQRTDWMVTKTGAKIWVEAALYCRKGPDGVPLGYVKSVRASGSAPRESTEHEERLRVFGQLIESTSDFVGVADPSGALIYQNRAGNLMIGWEANEDLAGKFLPDVHPAKAAKWILETAVPMALRDGSCSHETYLLHRDGTEIPVSQVIMAHRNSAGELEWLSTIMRDLRGQKRVESLLSKVAAQVQGALYQFELRPDGAMRFPYASAGAQELFEASPETLAQSASVFAEHLLPEELEQFQQYLLESAQNLTPWNAEYRYMRRDGSVRWHRGQSIPERQKDGSVLWHGFISDVTELREATEQTQKAQAELEQAISVLDAGFAMYDAEERLAICNERYAELYGLSADLRARRPKYEDLIRESFAAHPVFYQHLPEGMSLEDWLLQRLSEFRSPNGPKLQRLGERWVRIDEQRTANGGVVCMRTDVTTLKNTEYEARIQEQRLKLASSAAGVGVWELEPASGRLAWDSRMLEMFGYDPWEFSGLYEDWRVRLHPDDAQATDTAFQAALASGQDFRGRFRIVRPDGKVRHLDARTVASHDADGKVERVLGVNLDITDHIENEQRLEQLVQSAQTATKAKAEFLATMSHEIRTPMNGVIGMTNLLMGTDLRGEQREYVETIRASGESLLTLINDILDFSKMEAGKLVLERIAFSLEQVAMETIMLFTTQAESKGVRLIHELPAVPTAVVGDPVRVRQILLNLVSNALKFTRAGHVKIALLLDHGTESKVHVKLRVSDTGIGMAPEHLAKLGEAFLQADASTTRQFGGTGLGLSICRNLVDLMGGAMHVTSELGRGTTFEIGLPMVIAAAALGPREVVKPLVEASRKVARILVAEDNLVNQRVITLMLRNFADEVVVAADGREAVEKFREGSFDCILMDGHMPEMDGLEATRTIRLLEQDLERARTPIIALTANALPGDREACLGAGMDEYLTKPVRPVDLSAALSKVLPRQRCAGSPGV